MTLRITTNFLKQAMSLGSNICNKAVELLRKISLDPEGRGLNIEHLRNAPSYVRSVRIDKAFRGIGVMEGDIFTLVYCDNHEGAYRWMVGKDYEKLTEGAIDMAEMPEILSGQPQSSQENAQFTAFDKYTMEQLCLLGFSEQEAGALKAANSESAYKLLKSMFIGDKADILEYCEAGEDFADILDVIQCCRKDEEIHNPTLASEGVFIIDDENSVEEFRRAVNGEIEVWKLFLHPSQEKYAFGDYNGAALVRGEAGTGKTVAAVHRAKHLAESLENNERILVTTFTKNLSTDISAMLDDMNITNRGSIDVVNFDKLASEQFRKLFPGCAIMYDKAAEELWKQLISEFAPGTKFDAGFFQKEWERLIVPDNIMTMEEYRRADRTGMGYPMSRMQRDIAWRVIEQFRKNNESTQVEKNLAYKMLSDKLNANGQTIYKHIIADEIQDFSANMLSVISALSGKPHKNNIYMTGDPSQNIYGRKMSFSKCGIDIANRNFQLRVNYRTTDEIGRFALGLLGNSRIYDNKTLSLTHAKAPEVIKAEQDNLSVLLPCLEKIAGKNENVCIVTNRSDERDKISRYLMENDILGRIIDDKSTEIGQVNIATIRRVKGLEFDNVIIWGLNEWIVNNASPEFSSDTAASNEIENSLRSLAYVAATRARKGLICFVS